MTLTPYKLIFIVLDLLFRNKKAFLYCMGVVILPINIDPFLATSNRASEIVTTLIILHATLKEHYPSIIHFPLAG